MEMVEELVSKEHIEIEEIEQKIREVGQLLKQKQLAEWEWYRKEVARQENINVQAKKGPFLILNGVDDSLQSDRVISKEFIEVDKYRDPLDFFVNVFLAIQLQQQDLNLPINHNASFLFLGASEFFDASKAYLS